MKKVKVIILGSTGTIGRNTLSIIRHHRKIFKVLALSAYRNARLLKQQIEEFRPEYAALGNRKAGEKFSSATKKVRILEGEKGINKIASLASDITVVGISGLAALEPLVNSLLHAKRVLLANKEVIVACGHLLRSKFASLFNKVFPLDSELFSLGVILRNIKREELECVYITASGGPLWGKKQQEMDKVSLQDTLRHPNWKMGKKISVDSATLMNKGFEIIETQNIFGLSLDKIKVLVHRQSFMHALVKMKSGIILGTMFQPDMRIPIGYGLEVFSFQEPFFRIKNFPSQLNFVSPDHKSFPSLPLCLWAAKKGKSLPLVLVSADEAAVELYLQKKIKLTAIYSLVRETLKLHRPREVKLWEDVYRIDEWAKKTVLELAKRRFS